MQRIKSYTISLVLLVLLITFIFDLKWSFHHHHHHILNPPTPSTNNKSNNHSITSNILLFYVYADTHQYAYGNLKYFIETAVREGDGVDYIFILQQVQNKEINEIEMPLLPKGNAFYFQHENRCFDYGTIGWFIEKHTIGNPWKKQTSITNIRGPFFPPYFLKFLSDYQREFNEVFHWYDIFTKRINEKVKLVGCTINCVTPLHVQSYFLTRLSILLRSGGIDGIPGAGVFGCYPSKSDTIMLSELAISVHILQADYMVNSLLTKYYPLDFSRNDYNCPIVGNPYADKNMDETSLEPYEIIFVKFNDKEATYDAQNRAKLYQRWIEQAKTKNRTL